MFEPKSYLNVRTNKARPKIESHHEFDSVLRVSSITLTKNSSHTNIPLHDVIVKTKTVSLTIFCVSNTNEHN
jgi:hypothetical protein